MTILGNTEFGALWICARAVKNLDALACLTMSKEDDAAFVSARSELLSVIQGNGYRLDYDGYRLVRDGDRR
jgi:hypothetical protein